MPRRNQTLKRQFIISLLLVITAALLVSLNDYRIALKTILSQAGEHAERVATYMSRQLAASDLDE